MKNCHYDNFVYIKCSFFKLKVVVFFFETKYKTFY